jgi:hypothetical protein
MGRYGLTPYPYSNMRKYRKTKIDCFFDELLGLPYVIHSGKKLYFPKSHNVQEITTNYRCLITEQDVCSPHRYVYDINRLRGKTLLDVGAAEAIFTLDVIDVINHAYIFEYGEKWIEPLNATFAPWKDKMTIVRKYVGSVDNEDNITLDHFLENKEKSNLFLKMDVSGSERDILDGASHIFTKCRDMDFSITTYHKTDDAIEIAKTLDNYGYKYELTNGYLYFENELRKAIIRKR